MSTGLTVSVILNVFVIAVGGVYTGLFYESQAQVERQEASNRAISAQAVKDSDKRAAEITAKYEAKIAERDNALTALEQSVWATHDSEVLAIVEAGKFRKAHTDVPQPKGDTQSVAFGKDGSEYLTLFPAEQASLQASDAKFSQALTYLSRLGRVSCDRGASYTRGNNCTGSDAVGKRQVRMAL